MPREQGFYWVRSPVYGRFIGHGSARRVPACVSELYEARWWFTNDMRTPLESDPDIEVLSERLVLPEVTSAARR